MRHFVLLLALTLASACRAPSSRAPGAVSTTSYVVTLGSDTLAVDQSSRFGRRVEGILVTRYPRAVVTRYLVTLHADGTPATAESSTRLPDGSLLPTRIRSTGVTYIGDSAVMQQQRDTMVTARVHAPRAFPYVNYSPAFVQIALAATVAAGRDSASYTILPIGGRVTTPMGMVRRGANRYDFLLGPYRYAMRVNDAGVIDEMDGRGTTQQFIVRRVTGVDPMAIAAGWAQREAGALSSRDTVAARVGSANLWIDYGRPAKRGRAIFGANGVLGDTLWRTGANQATQFRTDVPITIGGQTVPAGTYTLWTVAVPGRYQLVVNRQHGQWGTVYDPAQDLVRVPLRVARIAQPVERFTIAIDPASGRAATLRLRWDTTELTVPIEVP